MKNRRLERLLVFTAALLLAISALGSVEAKKKGGGGVIRLEEMKIEGRVAKPNAFFINTRQALVYESMDIVESFVPEISRAVEDGPF